MAPEAEPAIVRDPRDPGRPLRVGVIGCGFFAVNHLHAWRDLAGESVVLAAICERDPDRLDEVGSRFGVSQRYPDANAMLAAEPLDLVDVVTTMESHRPLVELAAAHGRAAIVQKPMAPSLDDGRVMVAACAAAGTALMVHENFRFQTPIRRVKALLESGRLGQPFFARISWRTGHDVFAGQPYLKTTPRLILLDLVIHLLDVARFLFGEVLELTCRTLRVRDDVAGEDAATLLLIHEPGTTVVVDATYSAPQMPDPFPETLIEIDGSAGTLRLRPGYELVVMDRDGGARVQARPRPPDWSDPPWQAVQESVQSAQRHFVRCLRAGEPAETAGEDNLKTLALVEAAYRSAERSVTLRAPFD